MVIEKLKNKGILLGDWYRDLIVPVKDLRRLGYISESCPKAEAIKGKIINLPTYPGFSIENAKKVLSLIK